MAVAVSAVVTVARRMVWARGTVGKVMGVIKLINGTRRRIGRRRTASRDAGACKTDTAVRLLGLLKVLQEEICRAGVEYDLDNVLPTLLGAVLPRAADEALKFTPSGVLDLIPETLVAPVICDALIEKATQEPLVGAIYDNVLTSPERCAQIVAGLLRSDELKDFAGTYLGKNYDTVPVYLEPLLEACTAAGDLFNGSLFNAAKGGRKKRRGGTPSGSGSIPSGLLPAELVYLLLYHAMEVDPSATAAVVSRLAILVRDAPERAEEADLAEGFEAPKAPHARSSPARMPPRRGSPKTLKVRDAQPVLQLPSRPSTAPSVRQKNAVSRSHLTGNRLQSPRMAWGGSAKASAGQKK